MPEPADTGRRIKELRVSAGMTQHELAGSDVSASYISLVERGKRLPSGRALKILAARLGVGTADISGVVERPESTGRVRRRDLVGRLVAARRRWEGGDPEGALREFRSLVGTEPVGRPDDVYTESQLAIAEILGALGRADEGAAVLLRMLDALAPVPHAEARLRGLIALADLLEAAGRVQDGLRYALTGSLEAAGAQAPAGAFHSWYLLDALTRCAYWSGCAHWALEAGTGPQECPADGVLPGPRAGIALHRALDLWDRGETDRAAGLLAETARRVTPAAGFRLWEAVNGRHALLLLDRGEPTAARSIVERGLVVASVAREADFPLWLRTAEAVCAESAGDRDRVWVLGEQLSALPDSGRCHEKAAALSEIAAACARLGDRERAAGHFRYSAELFRRAQAYRHADRARERLAGLYEMQN
ncbi:helix-turn-helix domain-containing protein [Streptomyces sp. A1-5]|uniref:helix-turn-helix domain-containing protein n=1 Tax=Streptomyces sp. A1-5 TaxID=2738410 RepID=UPI001F31F57C|nr:helix-turn-helix transcriptional regulator [Streptomyces sp. A1-5]UJB42829.1 helix-turn-helix transcriptional regulator [Streptomyces sp. A1-5]